MSVKRKRHKLPEEDLVATVADIINSPITRSNLSFLQPVSVLSASESALVDDPATIRGSEITNTDPTSTAMPPVTATSDHPTHVIDNEEFTQNVPDSAQISATTGYNNPTTVVTPPPPVGALTTGPKDTAIEPVGVASEHIQSHSTNDTTPSSVFMQPVVRTTTGCTTHTDMVTATSDRTTQLPDNEEFNNDAPDSTGEKAVALVPSSVTDGPPPVITVTQPVVTEPTGYTTLSDTFMSALGANRIASHRTPFDEKDAYLPLSGALFQDGVTATSGYSNQTDEYGSAGDPSIPLLTEMVGRENRDLPPNKRRKVRQQRIAQDGHTTTEEIVYKALWDNGRPEQAETRVVPMGIGELTRRARMEYKNCKFTLVRLMEKLAIELIKEEVRETATPRTYRVFSYKAILERRRAKGLIYYVRTPRAILFVNADGSPVVSGMTPSATSGYTTPTPQVIATTAPVAATLGPTVGATKASLVTQTSQPPVASTAHLGTSLESSSRKQNLGTSTSTIVSEIPTQLMPGLRQFVPLVDEQAVWMLWTECRARVNDCTVEEILAFVQAKAPIALNGKIQNPVGFLLTAVPRCFEGAAFTAFREDERRRRADEENRKAREEKRLQELQEQGREEAEAYQKGKQGLESLSTDEYQALYEKNRNALLARYPNALRSAPKTIEDLVQQEMIRGLQN